MGKREKRPPTARGKKISPAAPKTTEAESVEEAKVVEEKERQMPREPSQEHFPKDGESAPAEEVMVPKEPVAKEIEGDVENTEEIVSRDIVQDSGEAGKEKREYDEEDDIPQKDSMESAANSDKDRIYI